MGLGKTYSTKYLVDSNNNTGAVGEVLISTATGINWANGSDIVGGPYLPLAGGTMTGSVRLNDNVQLQIGSSNDAYITHNGTHTYFVSGVGDLYLQSNNDDIVIQAYDDLFLYTNNGVDAIIARGGAAVELYHNNVKKFETTSTGVEVTGKITNLTAGTGNLDAVNVQQLNDATTGALIFKGTWSASPTTTSSTLGTVSTSTTVVISSPNAAILVGATVTGGGLPAGITVTAIAANEVTLTISSAQSIADATALAFTTVGGIPDLSQAARKVTGNYYICETAGVATPNGTGTTPDDWAVGDWVAFSDLATDAWQKIDNSSVLSGAGTGGTVPVWAGSGTSVTLGDSPITVSGASTIFGARGLFSDNVQIIYTGSKTNDAGLYIENDSDDWGVHVNKNTSNFGVRITSDGGNAFGIYSDAGVNKINFSGTGNAAFAGDVSVNGGDLNVGNSSTVNSVINMLGTNHSFIEKDTGADLYLVNNVSDKDIKFRVKDDTTNVIALTLDGSEGGNATFAGTVTSPTFIGDLNGTINTATTGATQTAGNNSTLIATTAYADAAAAAAPQGTVTGTGVAGEVAYWTSSTNIDNNAGMSFSNEQVQFDGIGGADGFALPYDENPGYSNMSAGGFGILFREARDNYILGNAYWYKTGGTAGWRAKYGAHAATMIGSDGGNITFETAPVNTTSPHALTFSPKMVIKNGGNVGIGVTAPDSKLHVVANNSTIATFESIGSNANSKTFIVQSGGDSVIFDIKESSGGAAADLAFELGNSEVMRLADTGNVGIGTTAPGTKLEIHGNNSARNTLQNILTINGGTNSNNVYSGFGMGLNFNGRDYSNEPRDYAYIYGVQEASSSSTAGGDPGFTSQLTFYTNTGGAVNTLPTQKMVINAAGNVGIGTTSPGRELVVSNTSGDSHISIVASSSEQAILLMGDSTNDAQGQIRYDNTDDSLQIRVNASERMRITSAGNVGIGTTAPGDILHVSKAGAATRLRVGNNGANDASIYFNTSTDWSIGTDTSNSNALTFGNSSAIGTGTKIVIETGGNVGIGTIDPDNKLDVVASDVNITPNAESSAVFRRNGNNYLTILSNASNEGGILFGNAADANDGGISYIHSTQTMAFSTADTAKMLITPAGDVLVGKTAVGVGTDGVELRANGLLSASRTGTSSNNVAYFNRNPDGGGNYGDGAVIQLRKNNVVVGVLGTEKWGIGTDNPAQALHVVGNAKVTGAYYDSNNSPGTAGQVLSSTATGTDWVAAGGGGGSTVYTAAIWEVISDTFTTNNTTIICDTNRIYNGTTSVSNAGPTVGSLVIDDAGVYEISYSVAVRVPQSGAPSTRQVPALYLTLTPNGGTEVNIPGGLNSAYLRLYGTNQGGFTSFSNKIYIEVGASAEIQLKIVWLDGSTLR